VRLSNGHGQYVFGWVATKGEYKDKFLKKLRISLLDRNVYDDLAGVPPL
jgi:hypothetical protein